ncbi:Ankyrin [Desulfatibacillum aliphaticivorans]|uniref:Ankyrin n=1 Tax=Desulfatibacillum aliphaticivorans TaxID=218208 RepID=B8FGQ0_DESAL|nr:ankyrin repeat domain-containing protein [Desulfatibacillum aliphaticivorans]ACL05280.1 Ankyrin [Desulfatibacillum aliphaticivorans]
MKRLGTLYIVFMLLIACLPASTQADTVVFKNGKRIDVEQAWEDGSFIKCIRFGGEISYPKSKVERIETSQGAAPASAAGSSRANAKSAPSTAAGKSASQNSRQTAQSAPAPEKILPVNPQGGGAQTPGGSQDDAFLTREEKMDLAVQKIMEEKRDVVCKDVKSFRSLDVFIRRTPSDAIRTRVEKFESGIFKAAYDGDLEQVRSMYRADPNVIRQVNSFGETPLHIAATMCHLDVAKFLVENGADVNQGSDWGYTPIMGAVVMAGRKVDAPNPRRPKVRFSGDWKGMIDFLSSKGADLNAVKHEYDPCDCNYCPECHPPRHSVIKRAPNGTALMMTWKNDVEDFLVEKGADVNIENRDGNTKFHYICAHSMPKEASAKSAERLNYWLSHGVDVNHKNTSGETPYDFGARNLKRECIEQSFVKLGRPVPYIPTHFEEVLDAIYASCSDSAIKSHTKKTGSLIKIKELLDRCPQAALDTDNKYSTLLHRAAWNQHPGAAEYLLMKGADPNAQDAWGETPLFKARTGEIAQILLDFGADPNLKDCTGKTALQENGSIVMEIETWRKGIPALEARLAEKAKERGPAE